MVEREWLDTLATLNASEITYTDFVTAGSMLSKELKEKGCDLVIALTHMRTPNDVRLVEEVDEIDLVLGGHDHVYEKKMVNGKYIIKSGTDFRQFSVLTVDFSGGGGGEEKESSYKTEVDVEAIEVTSKFEPDNELAAALSKYTDKMDAEMCKELGEFETDLDGRFSSIRSGETNLGNFICDIMVAATHADFAILNSGTFRSDAVHPAGPFFLKDLLTVLPMIDPLVLLEVTGTYGERALKSTKKDKKKGAAGKSGKSYVKEGRLLADFRWVALSLLESNWLFAYSRREAKKPAKQGKSFFLLS